jgi:nuclease-like protein
MAKLMNIRRADTCAGCGMPLAEGTAAYWDTSARVVHCVTCVGLEVASRRAAVDTDTLPTEANVPMLSVVTESGTAVRRGDIAGGSAKKEYEKRSTRELAKKEQRVAEDAEWRRSIKERRPVLGRIAAAMTPIPQIGPESQPTAAWKIGTEGERRVAEVLASASGIEVLHDRLVPGSRANIDHIVVGPSGVFVIDAKKYKGAIEVRNVGSLFRLDERLYVDGRDRSKLVEGVLGQIEVVRTALGEEFADVPIRGCSASSGATGAGS